MALEERCVTKTRSLAAHARTHKGTVTSIEMDIEREEEEGFFAHSCSLYCYDTVHDTLLRGMCRKKG